MILSSRSVRTWKQIASLGHGQFSTIQQDGGVQQIATPYDQKLAELSATIDSTTVIVGDEGSRVRYHRGIEAVIRFICRLSEA